jgi:hypothetical protein
MRCLVGPGADGFGLAAVPSVSSIPGSAEVNSKFFCYQNRLQDEVNHFVGRREDVLKRDPETNFKLYRRKIIIAMNVMIPKVVNTFF